LLESIDRLRSKLLVFHNASSVHVPPKYSTLYALLEPLLIPVAGSSAFSAFHPKLWLLRFTPLKGVGDSFRILVLSRNLTFDRSWDVAMSLDGVQENRSRVLNEPLVGFLRQLPAPGDAAERLEEWCDALGRVRWSEPEGFHSPTFLPGLPASVPLKLDTDFDDVLVVSPFVDADADGLLLALGARARRDRMLVSRGDTLDRIGKERLEGWNCYSIPDSIIDGGDSLDDGESMLHDLHAKMIVATQGRSASWHLGSANMTNAAFGKGNAPPRNFEFMLKVNVSSRSAGAKALERQWFDAGLIRVHEFREPSALYPEQEAAVRRLAHDLAAISWRMTAELGSDGSYTVRIEAPSTPPVPAGLEVTISLLCRASEQALSAQIEWAGVRLCELSAFISVHIRSSRIQPSAVLQAFAVKTDLTSSIQEERRDAVFREVISTPQRLLSYLAVLVDPGATKGKWRRAEKRKDDDGGGVFGFDGSGGLYEQLLRASARTPARISRAVEVAKRVEAQGINLPEGLRELLWSFEQAIQEQQA
jgi:hypothetical protein